MSRHIYALLVGIDAYAPPVLPLKGCVNDIQAVQDYLAGRLATDGYQLHIHTLLNHEATRQAIIDGFRHHLCQAGGDDVAFFYYAGHGSQEEAPEAFWPLEPDRLDETLVCYDSRTPGGWDLADKELAKLIAEVAQQAPHVAIILDCCHSGSGTRGEVAGVTAVRQAPIDRRQRPLASFICSVEEAEHLSVSRSPEANPTGWSFPRGRHVCLAACRDSELAKEYSRGGQHRGAFSYFLLDTLHKANGSLTYRDVFKRTNALVRAQVTAQSPQIEATPLSDLDQLFLGGVIAERPAYFTVSWHRDHGWALDGGAIHGIPSPSGDQTTVLALFPFDSPAARLRQVATAIGAAEVMTVRPHVSQVRMNDVEGLQPAMTFKAVIISLPLPPKGVLLEGEEEGIALVRAALRAAGPAQQLSLSVQEATTPEAAEFRLLARAGHYLIARPADDRPLVTSIQGYTSATASQAIQRLEHIARWTTIAELSSPATSRLRPDAVQLVLYQDGQELRQAQIRLEYHQDRGQWKQPAFKVKLTNTSSEPVYCALLDLTDRYAVKAPFLAGGGVWLGPGEEAWAQGGKDLYAEVAEELWKQGITESKDVLKLIVSTAAFDATLLEQERLDVPARAMRSAGRGRGTLNRLMHRVHYRDLSATPEEEPYDDWVTSQVVIMTVRPQEEAAIPSRGAPLALGAGVRVQAHPRLQARARLTTVTQSARDVGPHLLPPLLRAEHEGIQPLQFTASRGTDPGLSALELTQVADPSVVTRSEPLTLLVDRPLGEDEQVVPIGYDGEFFLPLGYARRTASGGTEIFLERLPAPVREGQRSLGGSIRIFFHKVVSQQLGLAFPYPVLAVAEVSAAETVRYIGDMEQVRARVAQAKTILLYLHGIIGDTQSLVPSVRRATLEVEGQERTLADCYDLVLTFDYENLNTSIEDNARLLKQRLAAVGLGAHHGKVLHLIAHSMGGLVARWFIERDGGHQVVHHLIMLGTPNAGSPWATVHDWALTVLTLGLNHLADMTWPGPVVGLLLKAISRPVKAIDAVHVSLEQMQPASALLRTLASSADPGIPYTILAGNTSIRAAARDVEAPHQPSLLQRLLRTLFGTAVALPFLGQPNDIAATVTSITSISRARSPQPRLQEVGCDHLVYFSHPEGLQALAAAVKHAQGAAQHSANT